MTTEKQFIKARVTAFTTATIWRKYTLAIEGGFVFLDREKLEAHEEHRRLFGAGGQRLDAGTRQFGQPPEQARTRRLSLAVVQPWVDARLEVCAAQTECRGQDAEGKDICLLVNAQHPGRARIQSGVRRKGLKCPRGLWPA